MQIIAVVRSAHKCMEEEPLCVENCRDHRSNLYLENYDLLSEVVSTIAFDFDVQNGLE